MPAVGWPGPLPPAGPCRGTYESSSTCLAPVHCAFCECHRLCRTIRDPPCQPARPVRRIRAALPARRAAMSSAEPLCPARPGGQPLARAGGGELLSPAQVPAALAGAAQFPGAAQPGVRRGAAGAAAARPGRAGCATCWPCRWPGAALPGHLAAAVQPPAGAPGSAAAVRRDYLLELAGRTLDWHLLGACLVLLVAYRLLAPWGHA